jgi:hypothetical protein
MKQAMRRALCFTSALALSIAWQLVRDIAPAQTPSGSTATGQSIVVDAASSCVRRMPTFKVSRHLAASAVLTARRASRFRHGRSGSDRLPFLRAKTRRASSLRG